MQTVGYVSLLAASLFPAALFAQSAPGPQMPAGQGSMPPQAVWQMQDSGTTAGLRGIDSINGKVAWASGTGGTVLRTTDGGAHWTRCATPDADKDGATLDFRGVQAWDAATAIVLSSGQGHKSRLYKTEDGCRTWKFLFANPEKDGFYDALLFLDRQYGIVLGDPADGDSRSGIVDGRPNAFRMRITSEWGEDWVRVIDPQGNEPGINLLAYPGESAFAASNTCMTVRDGWLWFGTSGSRVLRRPVSYRDFRSSGIFGRPDPFSVLGSAPIPWVPWQSAVAPVGDGRPSAGIFSLAFRDAQWGMAVGGDYTRPNDSTGTAAWTNDGGSHWTTAAKPPHGYRSAVEWSSSLNAWITVGTNGSDISRDDGRTWQPLDNGNWNALSLPFVVGPQGRIARLNQAAILLSSPQPH